MAKKMSPFAADFEGINKSADDKVFAMLKQAEKVPEEKTVPVLEKKVQPSKKTADGLKAESEPDNVLKKEKPEKKKAGKPQVEWGRPVAHFNTRIPERMAELLDDLVYKLRKKGESKTKQDLAHEAICDLLQKHSIC